MNYATPLILIPNYSLHHVMIPEITREITSRAGRQSEYALVHQHYHQRQPDGYMSNCQSELMSIQLCAQGKEADWQTRSPHPSTAKYQ